MARNTKFDPSHVKRHKMLRNEIEKQNHREQLNKVDLLKKNKAPKKRIEMFRVDVKTKRKTLTKKLNLK